MPDLRTKILKTIIFLLPAVIISCNIFSPEYEKFENLSSLGDNSTIDGLMKNFVYSYSFNDSFLYEEILDENFIFEYDNEGVYESWRKDEDVRITKRMFRSFKKIDLVFNTIFPESTSESDTTVFTSFRIDFHSGQEIISLTGFSEFNYKKNNDNDGIRYSIQKWRDLK